MLSPATLRRRIEVQGFKGLSDSQIAAMAPWLRFTPLVNALLVGMATAMRSVPLLVVLALFMAWGAAFKRHPFDRVYNGFIRLFENSPELPPSGWCRRTSFAVATPWLLGTAWLIHGGHFVSGVMLGLVMTAVMALLAATYFCAPSELLARIARLRDRSR
jgi:hypothetical protein